MNQQNILAEGPCDQAVVLAVQCTQFDYLTTGQLQRGVTAAALRSPTLPVILDLSRVEFLNSSALGVLVDLRQHLRRQQRPLILVGLRRDIRALLATSRLDQLFCFRDTLEGALHVLAAADATPG